MDRVLNSMLDNLFIYYHTPSRLILLLPSVISSKSLLLLLQEVLIGSVFFDRSSQNLYLTLSYYLYCMFLFLFELLIFTVKLKYTNSRLCCSSMCITDVKS
jgi:hypothetical protein